MRNVNDAGARVGGLALVLAVAGITLGCGDQSPSGPTLLLPRTSPAALTISSVSPNTGSTLRTVQVTILGTGFQFGATVTLDGLAVRLTAVSSGSITATLPTHAAGTVDVTVTNPDHQSSRLTNAFTFLDAPFTVTSSTASVIAGTPLSVSWIAPNGAFWDWVAFFPVDERSENYEKYWWQYTKGATSSTFALNAPVQLGDYQFRYLLDDGFVETARSGLVSVRAGAPVRTR